jgi:hypothetical protein
MQFLALNLVPRRLTGTFVLKQPVEKKSLVKNTLMSAYIRISELISEIVSLQNALYGCLPVQCDWV